MLKRVLIIGHNDLDGVAGVLGIKAAHASDHVIVKFCSYSDIDSTLLEAINNPKLPYDRIVLVDICFNPEADENKFNSVSDRWNVKFKLPEAISKFHQQGRELVVLDHHPRAIRLLSTSYKFLLHSDSLLQMSDEDGDLVAGSDLAAMYFKAKQQTCLSKFSMPAMTKQKALLSLCKICGTYDVWNRNSYYFDFGSKLAIIQSLMSDDCYSFLAELEKTLDNAINSLLLNLDQHLNTDFWKKCLTPTLEHYLNKAEVWFEEEVQSALKNVIQHHAKLHEIHTNFFESLVAEQIYNKTQGIVLVRYNASRDNVSKLSLRKHKSVSVNLGTIAKQFGGGGHFSAAGMPVKSPHNIQDVVETILYFINAESTRKFAL